MQVEAALEEKNARVICLGDFNIDRKRLQDENYYLQKLANEYQGFLALNGMIDYDFGYTWSRIHENGTIRRSAIDQCITNSPEVLANPSKVEVGFSDHDAIFVDLKTSKKPKEQASQIVRNMGKLRRNPDKFQQMIANIPWEKLAEMESVHEMAQ